VRKPATRVRRGAFVSAARRRDGREVRPERDRVGSRTAGGSRRLSRALMRREETDFQSMGSHDHPLDMPVDKNAIRQGDFRRVRRPRPSSRRDRRTHPTTSLAAECVVHHSKIRPPMSAVGQIRPWCSIGGDGSLSPNSFRARGMLLTAESGQTRLRRPPRRRAYSRPVLLVSGPISVRSDRGSLGPSPAQISTRRCLRRAPARSLVPLWQVRPPKGSSAIDVKTNVVRRFIMLSFG
jgi:hypothetical protein